MRGADRQTITGCEIQSSKKRCVGGDSIDAVTFGQRIGERQRRIEHNFARHGIGAIDSLDLDERRLAIVTPRHGAQERHGRDASLTGKKITLRDGQFALDQIERSITAEDCPALLGEPILERK